MELVKGVPITEYCDQCNLTTRQRLELFITVCQAVQHAHQKGVIHRDIKPTNVLVAIQDGQPAPKIIDFGVAKAIDQRLTERTLTNAFAQMVGSPLYMSPEQAELSPLGVDTRSDIYSLGVLLYELLAGTTPFDKDRLQSASYDELRRIIREEEPPRPSTRLSSLRSISDSLPLAGRDQTSTGDPKSPERSAVDSRAASREGASATETAALATTIAERRRTDPRLLVQTVRGELDWIVMKCLEKDRNRRYESAGGLARDIERYLHDDPVQACPPTAAYRISKFARRNKGILVATCFVALSLGVGFAVSIWQAAVAHRAEALAEARLLRSQQVNQLMTDMLKGVAPGVALGRDTQLLREILDRTAERLDKLQVQPEVEADLRATLGNVYTDLGEPTSAAVMHKKALELRKKLLGDEHPDVALSLHDLGEVIYWDNRSTDAQVLHREAVERRRKLSNDPNKLAEAAAIYRKLLDLDPQGATEHNYHLRLAELMFRTTIEFDNAQAQEVRRLIRRAIEGYAQVATQYPNDLYRRVEAAQGYVTVAGLSWTSPGLRSEVEDAHRRLLAELSELRSTFPNSIQCQWLCAMTYRRSAFVVLDNNVSDYLTYAEQDYREAIKLLENKSLAAADPLRVSHCLASTHGYLGDVLIRLNRTNEAEAEFRTAIDLYEQRPPDIEREPFEDEELALDYTRFAYLLATLQKPEEAKQILDKAAHAIERLGGSFDSAAQRIFCLALVRLTLEDKSGYREACAALEKAAEKSSDSAAPVKLLWTYVLGPNAVDDLNGPLKQAEAIVANPSDMPYFDRAVLGAVHYRMSQYDRAVPLLEKSIAQYAGKRPIGTGTVLFPKLLLAMTRWQQGDRDEARRMLDEIQPAINSELQSPLSLWQRRAQLEILRREAETLIEPKEAEGAPNNDNLPPSTPANSDHSSWEIPGQSGYAVEVGVTAGDICQTICLHYCHNQRIVRQKAVRNAERGGGCDQTDRNRQHVNSKLRHFLNSLAETAQLLDSGRVCFNRSTIFDDQPNCCDASNVIRWCAVSPRTCVDVNAVTSLF
jgi:tetratricopeptide (TPR) repeat protein